MTEPKIYENLYKLKELSIADLESLVTDLRERANKIKTYNS